MEQEQFLLEAVSPTLQYTGIKLSNPHSFSLQHGKCYVAIGENGCGKTTLGKIIEKGWNIGMNKFIGDKQSLKIKNIEFSDIHALTGCKESYYQQRYEATQNDAIPTVDELIKGKISEDLWNELCETLSLYDIRHKRVNFLSSGELRKFLIINLFTSIPDLLIIDNPYIGLDTPSRELFDGLINSITQKGTTVLLLLCNPLEIPCFTDYILPINDLSIGKMIDVSTTTIEAVRQECEVLFTVRGNAAEIPLPTVYDPVTYSTAFELRHCNVNYGNTTILQDISWKVEAGENWALLGENGAGKSTLLSLVYADNPQGYKNDITLFDHHRGTGESIWDIKKNIGYISPEMHLYFNNGEDVMTVVASGFHDNVGCFRRINDEQKSIAMRWLSALGIGNLANRRFNTLSSGEQRLALLARTFLKNAPLLILDEPLHGLDMLNKQLVAKIVERIATRPKMSLIYVTHYTREIPECVGHTFHLKKHRSTTECE